MTFDKICIKFFLATGQTFPLDDLIPVFHDWIREKKLPDLMIDVADYRHVNDGPKLLLVAHEANYVIDFDGGRPGLLYQRKQPLPGTMSEKLTAAYDAAVFARDLLEKDCSVVFERSQFLFQINDRLDAQNTPANHAVILPLLVETAKSLLGGPISAHPASIDPRERLGFTLQLSSTKN